MFYTIYKITNQIDGKFYIGSHKTKDLNDNYMGSGKYLKYAQNKYGIENFKKEILFVFETAVEMYAKEAEIINQEFLVTENTYNLKIGGFGGWDYLNYYSPNLLENKRRGREGANKKLEGMYGENWNQVIGRMGGCISGSKTYNMKIGIHSPNFIGNSFKGKRHSAETKKKIGNSTKITSAGERNSQYGTRWIYSPEMKISKKLPKEQLLPEGWIEGRKIKF